MFDVYNLIEFEVIICAKLNQKVNYQIILLYECTLIYFYFIFSFYKRKQYIHRKQVFTKSDEVGIIRKK